jgi:hypothetical protein
LEDFCSSSEFMNSVNEFVDSNFVKFKKVKEDQEHPFELVIFLNREIMKFIKNILNLLRVILKVWLKLI